MVVDIIGWGTGCSTLWQPHLPVNATEGQLAYPGSPGIWPLKRRLFVCSNNNNNNNNNNTKKPSGISRTDIKDTSQLVTRSSRHTVNLSHSQLVTVSSSQC